MMEFSESMRGDIHVVALSGKLDTIEADSLHQYLRDRIQAGANRMILDATQLTYIGSSGLRVVILAVRQIAEASGRIAICGLNERLQRIFATVGFSKILDIYESLDEAAKGVEAAP